MVVVIGTCICYFCSQTVAGEETLLIDLFLLVAMYLRLLFLVQLEMIMKTYRLLICWLVCTLRLASGVGRGIAGTPCWPTTWRPPPVVCL